MSNIHSDESENNTSNKTQKKQTISARSTDTLDADSMNRSLVLWSPGGIQDIAVLHQGFNLHHMPSNYLTRKSYVEQLIYHATMADRTKSPFSSFRLANENLNLLDDMDIITGVKSLKSFIKSVFQNSGRTSAMVHRFGNTWLLDEFDIDSFLLTGGQCSEWLWLRHFLRKQKFQICANALSRNVLILRDLESKFLYHTVSQSSELDLRYSTNTTHPSLPPPSSISLHPAVDHDSGEYHCLDLKLRESGSSSIEPPPSSEASKSSSSSSHMSWFSTSNKFLHTATWHLQDLSFLVGSDLAIFGTPKHPCVSLKLSPAHESINVLTGIDIWLENIINEVPEVAMCYHHEGIVMQEYEIYKTSEIPEVSGFETEQIYRIIQNLVMFLKRNATQEGHTYWLVKEPGLGVVKLYDLTNLGLKDVDENWSLGEDVNGNPVFYDTNPFILPVAILCYKLAERRYIEYSNHRQRQFSDSEPSDPEFNETDVVIDTLRLAKNCLNLLSVLENAVLMNKSDVTQMPPGLSDLKSRAILLVCQLYLITPSDLISACIRKLQNLVCSTNEEETVTANVDDFNSTDDSFPAKTTSTSLEHETPSADSNWTVEKPPSYLQSVRKLMGNSMIEALKSSNVTQLSQLASSILEQYVDPSPLCAPKSNSALELQQAYRNQTEQGSEEAKHLACLLYSSNQKPDPQCLPLVLLKSYINRSQVLWTRLSPQLHAFPSHVTSSSHDYAHTMFRHLIPALLLLEHVIPDKHTILLSSPDGVHPSKPACPNCSLPGSKSEVNLSNFDRHFLLDALNAVSSLFAGLVISYPELLSVPNAVGTEFTAKTSSPLPTLGLPSSSDRLLLRSACPQSVTILETFVKVAVGGPVDINSVRDLPDAYSQCESWVKLLERAIACLHRSLSRSQSKKDRQSSRKADKHSVHGQQDGARNPGPVTASGDFGHSQIVILPDWWSIMTNMFVAGLRNLWLARSSQDENQSQFESYLLRGLNMLNSTPIKLGDLSEASQFLRNSSEFQFYKLAALYSQQQQQPKQFGVEFINQLVFCPTTPASSILPLEAIHPKKPSDDTDPNSSTSICPTSIVGICLARAIEAQLRQLESMNYANEDNLPVPPCVDLLRASNEYLQIQFENSELVVGEAKSSQLNLLHNVLKLVLKHLPSKLITNSSSLTMTSTITTQFELDWPPNSSTCLFDPQIIRNLIILRLNQLKLTLFRFHDGVTFKRQKSQIPSWFNLVNQIRATLNWHLVQMSYSVIRPTSADEFGSRSAKQPVEQCLQLAYDQGQIELIDLVLHLCLASHLITWQSVNQGVLSSSGLITILRDIHFTLPIIKALDKCLSKSDCSQFAQDINSAFNTIRENLNKLVKNLAEKSGPHMKRDQGAKTKSKKKKQQKPVTSNPSGTAGGDKCSTEHALWDNLNKIPNPPVGEDGDQICANLALVCKDFLARLECVSDYFSEL